MTVYVTIPSNKYLSEQEYVDSFIKIGIYLHIYKQSSFREQSTIVFEFRNRSTKVHRWTLQRQAREDNHNIIFIHRPYRKYLIYLRFIYPGKHRTRAVDSMPHVEHRMDMMHLWNLFIWIWLSVQSHQQPHLSQSVVFIVFCCTRKGKAQSKVISRIQPNQFIYTHTHDCGRKHPCCILFNYSDHVYGRKAQPLDGRARCSHAHKPHIYIVQTGTSTEPQDGHTQIAWVSLCSMWQPPRRSKRWLPERQHIHVYSLFRAVLWGLTIGRPRVPYRLWWWRYISWTIGRPLSQRRRRCKLFPLFTFLRRTIRHDAIGPISVTNTCASPPHHQMGFGCFGIRAT